MYWEGEVGVRDAVVTADMAVDITENENEVVILETNLKAVLLYGAETWRLTDAAEAKVAGIYQQKLRHILLIFCGDW